MVIEVRAAVSLAGRCGREETQAGLWGAGLVSYMGLVTQVFIHYVIVHRCVRFGGYMCSKALKHQSAALPPGKWLLHTSSAPPGTHCPFLVSPWLIPTRCSDLALTSLHLGALCCISLSRVCNKPPKNVATFSRVTG